MSQELHISELIERYLNADMPLDEQLSFEKKMALDPELARLVEETRLTNEALHLANLAALKESIGTDIKKIPHRPNSGRVKTGLAVASLLLAGTLAYVLVPQKEKSNASETTVKQTVRPEKSSSVTPDKTLESTDSEEKELPIKQPKPSKTTASEQESVVKTEKTRADSTTKKLVPKNTSTLKKITEVQKDASPSEEKEVSKQQKTTVSVNPDKEAVPCNRTFDISTTASCPEEANGTVTLHLDEIEDYNFQLERYNISGNQFYDVAAGDHQLVITYGECRFQKTINIPEKNCGWNSSFSFNPDYGERWNINYPAGEQGTFVIYNARGREIYKANFGNGKEYWDGSDYNGNPAPVGNYFALIKYANNPIERVELTIVR